MLQARVPALIFASFIWKLTKLSKPPRLHLLNENKNNGSLNMEESYHMTQNPTLGLALKRIALKITQLLVMELGKGSSGRWLSEIQVNAFAPFERVSHPAGAGLTMPLRLALNSCSSSIHLPSAGILSVHTTPIHDHDHGALLKKMPKNQKPFSSLEDTVKRRHLWAGKQILYRHWTFQHLDQLCSLQNWKKTCFHCLS